MPKSLLLTACPFALIAAATPANAQTVSSNTGSNLNTSTTPADITINSGITVSPASGAAVTVDSNNSVTNNGTISFTDVSDATGILASTGLSGTITNAGTITNTETSTASDSDSDGDNDTPLANGANRYGIHGAGTFVGTMTNSGTITVTGNTSAGIAVDGSLTGSLVNSGTITVIGSDSDGIHAQAVSGDITVSGAVTAQGENAVAVALDGDIGGAVAISSTVTSTGFRATASVYSYPDSDDLLIGGPAVRIGGSVAGGVSLTSAGAVYSYGSAPALQIGSAAPVTLGLASGSNYGLVLAGTVGGLGVNVGVDAHALTIGGAGGSAMITGGISNTGTITATGNQANATAVELAGGAMVPTVNNTGSITATGGVGAYTANAVLVDTDASLPSLVNSGSIIATSSGNTGSTTAVRDLSGTLTSITNSGTITASLTGTYGSSQATAIDLSANTSGVTITQTAGSINGAIVLGAGDDTLTLSGASAVKGNVDFGTGVGTLSIAGTSNVTGALTFGAGSSMTIADTASFTGALVQNGNPLALIINGGSFNPTSTAAVGLGSLTVGSTGMIGVIVDPATATSTTYNVAGLASFSSGATVKLTFNSLISGSQSYSFLTAGSLSGTGGLAVATSSLPYLYAANLVTDSSAGTVSVTVAPKTAAELGLNRSGTAAYGAVYAAIGTSTAVENAFLGATDAATFNKLYGEMLPDHAGGAFISTSDISRGAAALMASGAAGRTSSGPLSLWIGQLGSRMTKSRGDTEAYGLTNYGLAAGAEYALGRLGSVGLGYDWSYNAINNSGNDNEVVGYLSELSGYWRGTWGGLNLHARGAVGRVSLESKRFLESPTDETDVLATAAANWHASTVAFNAGGSFELPIGRFFGRPMAQVDYFRLDEDAHAEAGGGDVYDLAIGQRNSHALTGAFSLAAGYKLSTSSTGSTRLEVEIGDRLLMKGTVADTTASFAGGTSFTLQPDTLRYGPLGALRFAIDNEVISFSGEVRAQKVEEAVSAGFAVGVKLKM